MSTKQENKMPSSHLDYINHISPTFKSSPLFGPELTPPLYQPNQDCPKVQNDFSHSPISVNHLGKPYPINKKGNRAMALEDRFENDPKMYHIWPQESNAYKRLLYRDRDQGSLGPLCNRRVTSLGNQELKEANQKTAWGTHIHEYAGIGGLSFLGQRARTRDLDVARSHRHYLSGMSFSLHDKITRNSVTPFKKSLNRQCDDLIPPANQIPLDKYHRLIENNKFIQEDRYASHINRTEMFPLRSSRNLTPATEEVIQNLMKNRYQTSYSTNFYDQAANTALKLGPQFQFYDDGLEGEVYESEKELWEKVKREKELCESGELIEDEVESRMDEKCSQVDESESKKEGKDDQSSSSSESGDDEDEDSKTVISVKNEETEDSKPEEVKTDEEKPVKESDSQLTITSSLHEAAWPAWPGNRCNQIDPVTLKIAEKRDVASLQDKYDIKALQNATQPRQPNYAIPENLDHAITSANSGLRSNFNHKFAPARVDFAYSGQPVFYGNREEQFQQPNYIDMRNQLRQHNKFEPLSPEVEANVIRKIVGQNSRLLGRSSWTPEREALRQSQRIYDDTADRESSQLRVSESVENLRNTIENIRQPSESINRPLPPLTRGSLPLESDRISSTRKAYLATTTGNLPPLWETLDYTSNRIVDQLGVRYKSIAQSRYHHQHPESAGTRLENEYLGQQAYLKQDDRHTTYRRQYYNGYHMGSNFR